MRRGGKPRGLRGFKSSLGGVLRGEKKLDRGLGVKKFRGAARKKGGVTWVEG